MVYIFAVVGLIAGFILGLLLLRRLLAGKTRQELMYDKRLWRKYGTLCWVISLLAMFGGILLYRLIFPH